MCINCGPCLQYNNVNYPAIGYFSSYTFRNRKIWGTTCDYYILSHQVKTLSSFISFFNIFLSFFYFLTLYLACQWSPTHKVANAISWNLYGAKNLSHWFITLY